MNKEELVKKVRERLDSNGHGYNIFMIIPATYDILKEVGCLKEEIKLPVVKTWNLKKEYKKFMQDAGISNATYTLKQEEHPEYYDATETVDYSRIPVGSIIEVETVCRKHTFSFTVQSIEEDKICGAHMGFVLLKNIKSLKVIRSGAK